MLQTIISKLNKNYRWLFSSAVVLGIEAKGGKTILCALSALESMPESKMEEIFFIITNGI